MNILKSLWDNIDAVLEREKPDEIVSVFRKAMSHGDNEMSDKYEYYYAAGYVAYMYPREERDPSVRDLAAKAFLLSLFHRPGHFLSVLYLAFIKMDEKKYLDALELLYSLDRDFVSIDEQLIDRYYEAAICCLIEVGFWSEASRELDWFYKRKEKDNSVGIDLINFMKVLDKASPVSKIEKDVIEGIESILV